MCHKISTDHLFLGVGCSRRSDFRWGSLGRHGAWYTNPKNFDSPEQCAERVRTQYPTASGVTWGRYTTKNWWNSDQRDCFADFAGPNVGAASTSHWEYCLFDGK